MRSTRLDLSAVAASALAVVMVIAYTSLAHQQQTQPALWALSLLVAGAFAAAYGALRAAPLRRAALGVAAAALLLVGTAGILTIGLPILLAGVLCVVAAVRGLGEQSP